MVLEPSYGLMEQNILASGSTEKPRVKELFTIPMATYLWDNSKMIRPMVRVNTCTKIVKPTKANGLKTCSMEMEKKVCLMEVPSRVSSKKDAKMGMEFTSGPTIPCMKVCGKAVKSMAEESMSGPMAGDMRANGVKISCTEKGRTSGLMAEYIQESTKWIRNMDMAAISGQMVRNMKASGKTGSNTDKVSLRTRRANAALAFGKMGPD